MVTAKLVCPRKGLRQRYVGGGCGVYFDGRGARCRENLSRCYGEGEDVGDMSIIYRMRCEVLFRHCYRKLEGMSD